MKIDDLSIIRTFREELPGAVGAAMSDEALRDIALKAVGQCFALQDGGNTDWLENKNIQNALLLLAYIHGDKPRKNNGISILTHSIGVAHRTHNSAALQKYDPIFAAFCGLNHDTTEDSHKAGLDDKAVAKLMLRCWQETQDLSLENEGDVRPSIENIVRSLTDVDHLVGSERYREQIKRAKLSMGKIGVVIRYNDKLDNVSQDLRLLEEGKITDESALEFVQSYAWHATFVATNLPSPVTLGQKRVIANIAIATDKKIDSFRNPAPVKPTSRRGKVLAGGKNAGEFPHSFSSLWDFVPANG
ncbi:MAG: hypothetical protein HGA90_04030 [Alphaproteobacteria bacterium]|nr:hypothetical protein [Alphaproteobacteria bacterium]